MDERERNEVCETIRDKFDRFAEPTDWFALADWHLARVREARAKAFEEAAYAVASGGPREAHSRVMDLAAREREVPK